jgi:excinuclease UvrABC helicase subunit UvrB
MMRRRKNFFGGLENLDEILRQLLGDDESIINEMTSGIDQDGEWMKRTIESPSGNFKSTVFYRAGFGGGAPVEKNNTVGYTLNRMKKDLETAVENEDFKLAIYLRDQIKKLEQNTGKIEELQNEMKKSIEEQNFERAIEIREELNKLKS